MKKVSQGRDQVQLAAAGSASLEHRGEVGAGGELAVEMAAAGTETITTLSGWSAPRRLLC
ncbi:MAG: hypothetical protein JWQ47_37 [Glaciihabitans sp.]|nr:hypothetical protein [Glaciihabitans sp.]